MKFRRGLRLLVAGVLIQAAFLVLLLGQDLRANIPLFLGCYAVAFLAYAVAIGARTDVSFRSILLFGIAFRLTTLVTPPSLSDDIYRYVWDGAVQNAGVNPYAHTPDKMPTIPSVRAEALRGRINHSHLHTIYPPAAQLFFRIATAFHDSVWSIKVGTLFADLLTAWFIVGLLRAFDLEPRAFLLYWWNPLLLVEGGIEAHIDVLGLAFVMLALLYGQVSGPGRSAVALAASALTKVFPLVLLPVLWRWSTAQEDAGPIGRLKAMLLSRGWTVPCVFAAVCAGFYGFYAEAGIAPFGSLTTYVLNWDFNGLIFRILRNLTGNGLVARAVLGGLFCTAVLVVALSGVPALLGMFVLCLVYLLLTPTFHPWYGLWIVPFLPFYPYAPAIALTGSVAVAHYVLIGYDAHGVWTEEPWVAWCVWALPLAIGVLGIVRNRKGAPLERYAPRADDGRRSGR